MGHTRLNKDLIQQTPVLFGEADIIKTLQTLPGVSAGTAGLAGMYVRGGNGDRTKTPTPFSLIWQTY